MAGSIYEFDELEENLSSITSTPPEAVSTLYDDSPTINNIKIGKEVWLCRPQNKLFLCFIFVGLAGLILWLSIKKGETYKLCWCGVALLPLHCEVVYLHTIKESSHFILVSRFVIFE